MGATFFTIGHSNRTIDDFLALLREADIQGVADIRKIPKSRTNPQFNRDTLPGSLAARGIAYEHIAALGGRRGREKGVAQEVNRLWTNGSFHNYADYALSQAFADGLAHLREEGHQRRTAMMCSEAVWWRCHRRIVADHLIAHGEAVFHIMGKGRLEAARLTPGAVARPDGSVVYPAMAEIV
ncbi:MAG TPA: DUF488 domain-containing protein [Rhizomicrobium sp.]|nr:DUF488 domain-containing protein [Rhizomicrobium sp.]